MTALDAFAAEVEAAQARVPGPHDMELLSSLQLDRIAYWVRELRKERDALVNAMDETMRLRRQMMCPGCGLTRGEEHDAIISADRKTIDDLRALLRRWVEYDGGRAGELWRWAEHAGRRAGELWRDTAKALEKKP